MNKQLITDGTMLALQENNKLLEETKIAVQFNNELLEHQINRMDRQRKVIITFGIIGIIIFLGLLFYMKSTNTIFWWMYTYSKLGCN